MSTELLRLLGSQRVGTLLAPGLSLLQIGVGVTGMRRARGQVDALSDAAELQAHQVAQSFVRRAGEIRSAFAASGVDVGTGTPLDLLAENAMASRLAQNVVRYNFAVRRERALAEGIADLTAGVAGATRTGLSALRTALDTPTSRERPIRFLDEDLESLGVDRGEFPLLTGGVS